MLSLTNQNSIQQSRVHSGPWTNLLAETIILNPPREITILIHLILITNDLLPQVFFFKLLFLQQYYVQLKHTNIFLHNSVHSLSAKWQAMCWLPWTSLTTCLWRTWGSSAEPSCMKTATPLQSSSITDVTETSACASSVSRTWQVSDWILFWFQVFRVFCNYCLLSKP